MASACGGRNGTDRGGRNGTDRAVGLAWMLAGADGPLEVHSSSSDPRSFKLPAFSLDVGTYVLTVTATDIFDVNASEVVKLTVPRAKVVATIDGGAARSASAAEDLRLSASSSRDEDVEGVTGAAAGLVFNWTCGDFVLDDAESIVVPAGALSPEQPTTSP
ncbi:hypothetical protein JL721_3111 [Aureococcus anophagefferens]|nr:hypothetical protein JL721_3111 [Aureococcus anophagefferens]